MLFPRNAARRGAPSKRTLVVVEPVEIRLIAVATEHVRRFGGAKLRIVDVAAETGMTHANVYRYFASRADLIEAITAAWLKPLEARLREPADGADPAYDKLERMLLAVHRAYRLKLDSDPKVFDLFVDGLTRERESARKHRARVQSEMQRVVEEGIASGAFALDRRRALALVFDASHRFIHPIALRLDRDLAPSALVQRFERIVSMTLRALRTGRT